MQWGYSAERFQVSRGGGFNDELTGYRSCGYRNGKPASTRPHGSFEVARRVKVVRGNSTSRCVQVRIRVDPKERRITSISEPRTGERCPRRRSKASCGPVQDGDRPARRLWFQFLISPRRFGGARGGKIGRFFSPNGLTGAPFSGPQATSTGRAVHGGSTLTQQIIKNDFLTATEHQSKRRGGMEVISESRTREGGIFTIYCNDVYGAERHFRHQWLRASSSVTLTSTQRADHLQRRAFLAGVIGSPTVLGTSR